MTRAVVLAGVIALMVPAAVEADSPMPIDFKLEPATVLSGKDVVVRGTTPSDGKRTVQLTVAPPSGPPVSTSVPVDGTGKFTITYKDAKSPGKYQVKVVAPDGKGSAVKTLLVIAPGAAASEAARSFEKTVTSTLDVVKATEALVEQTPDSPARQQLQDKLKDLDAKLAQAPQQSKSFSQAIQQLADVQSKHPSVSGVVSPVLEKLAAWSGETQTEVDDRKLRVMNELERSRQSGKKCDLIDAATEGFKVASAMLNFASTGMNILKSFLKDYASGAGAGAAASNSPAMKNDPAGQFALGEALKLSENLIQGPSGWIAALPGLCLDIAAFASDQYFKKFCERFNGPFTATMHGEVFRNDKAWWTFDMTLEGKIDLRYAKASPGEAIAMNGQFDGSVTSYDVWEDSLNVLHPELMRGAKVVKKVIKPVGMPFVGFEGRYASQALPTAFSIAVKGDLVGKQLTLHIGEALREPVESYNTTRVLCLIASPLALIPAFTQYDLPFQKARDVVMRSMEAEDGNLPLQVEITKDSMKAEKKWKRNKPGEGVKADYTATVKLCNPGC